MAAITHANRILVAGKTGSGKTYLIKHLFWQRFRNRLFYDSKLENGDLAVGRTKPVRGVEKLRKYLSAGWKDILYQPETLEVDEFDEVCRLCYLAGDIALFVDEASQYTTPSKIALWHRNIMARGRSRRVGVVNATQRPRGCHNDLISESEHFFIFRLILETDVQKFSSIIERGTLDKIRLLPRYHYLYANIDGRVEFRRPV